MSGTVKTNAALLAEYPDNTSGLVTPAKLRDLPATMQSLTMKAITPQQFGAAGDGATNDTTALQNWANAATAGNLPMYLPPGTYTTTGLIITASSGTGNVGGNVEQNGPSDMYGAGEARSIIQARSGATSPLIKAHNLTQTRFANFGIDCNSLVATGFDTSWNVNFGPSLQNVYDHLEIRNYTGTTAATAGWVATANNDCGFHNCILDGGGTTTMSLGLDGHGGNVVLSECFFGNTFGFSAQSMQIWGCVTSGIRVVGFDVNEIKYFGGYHYADNGTHINLDVPNTFALNVTAFGARFENNTNGGFFIGGTSGGQLNPNGATFHGCRFLNTSAGGTPILISTNLANGLPAGLFGMVRLEDCLLSLNITAASTSAFYVVLHDCNDDNDGSVVGTSAVRVGRGAYTDVLAGGVKMVDASARNMGNIFSTTVTAASGTPGAVVGIPRAGYCIIMLANTAIAAPVNTQFRYYGTTKDTAFGTGITTAAITGTSTLTLTITPASGSSLVYAVTIFGQQS